MNERASQAYVGDDRVVRYYPGDRQTLLLTCEHAGNRLPTGIGSLSDEERRVVDDHWGWDIGAYGLSMVLAQTLSVPLVSADLSRLVCDLNRPLDAPDLHRQDCEGVKMSFNIGLDDASLMGRREIHRVFHAFTQERIQEVKPGYLISIHSFTPVWNDVPREVEVGILFNRYESTAKRLKTELEALGVSAHLNAPYSGFEDGVYSIERHGREANLPYLELEIRQDLICEREGQEHWGALLSGVLSADLFIST